MGVCIIFDIIMVLIWCCDIISVDGCLSLIEDEVIIKSFKMMVWEKMEKIFDKIVNCLVYDDMVVIIGFLNVIDLFIYKMLVVMIIFNNILMVDVLIGCYQELIVVKYVEVYI